MKQPEFIDFHTHPDIKSYLSANTESARKDCWREMQLSDLLEKVDHLILKGSLGSQSCLDQLNNSDGTIALVGLYAFEKAMLTGNLIDLFGVKVTPVSLARTLKEKGYNDNSLDPDLLDRISSKGTSYFKVFSEMLNHLDKSRLTGDGYKLLGSINEYDQKKLNLIFTIEGGHNLCGDKTGSKDYSDARKNLEQLKKSDYRFFSLCLAHIENTGLCNHAFAMKMLKHEDFKPKGFGITPTGMDVINEALSKPKRILIDIKHMSLVSRMQYYEFLKNYRSERIPILISHAGLTGTSYKNMPVEKICKGRNLVKLTYTKPLGIDGTRFNPWSVNLYDEELRKIIESEGIIGLNMDVRIMGTKQKLKSQLRESFSKREFNFLKIKKSPLRYPPDELSGYEIQSAFLETELKKYIKDLVKNRETPGGFENFSNIYNTFFQQQTMVTQLLKEESDNEIKHLCNSILHIVKIAGGNAWKHICIGSDFDGFINAMRCCANATYYRNLRDELEKYLPLMAKKYNPEIIIPDLAQNIEDIMSGNAYRFLQIHFS
jgi:microsomal dipeptidase-like Zn-dependent dipeptidase